MLQIHINGQLTDLGAPLPDHIFHADIVYQPFPQFIMVTSEQEPLIRQWLTDLISRCKCEYISYNGVLNCVEDLQNPKS